MMRKSNKLLWVALILIITTGIYLISFKSKQPIEKIQAVTADSPEFDKEGELWFLDSLQQDTIKKIDIEIADDPARRTAGMMHRTSMEESEGMLFIFPDETERSFWMKNTILSLDIIFVTSDLEIATIYKHTQPYLKSPIPSFKPAMYVVETVAGFCDKHGITEGGKIAYKRD